MKKLKRFYRNNRIYCILMLISFFCFILMGSAVVIYFLHQTTTSPYGNRLDRVDEYPVSTELNAVEKYFKDEVKAKSVSVRLQGKLIYINVNLDNKTTIEEIQNYAVVSLDKIMDDQKAFYDIEFTFTREGYPPYQGSKSSTNTVITWANYDLSALDITTTTEATTTKKKK